MPALNFGQPQAGVFQMAYVVPDIEAGMREWIEQLHVGPWFLHPKGETRGRQAVGLARGGRAPRHGFHHFGVGTADYDGEIARHAAEGHALAFECAVPTGGRVGYVDTTAELHAHVEVIEMDAPTEATFTRFYAQALTWDGSGPVRPFR